MITLAANVTSLLNQSKYSTPHSHTAIRVYTAKLVYNPACMMEEEDMVIWDIVVKRWKESKQEYADAVTELVLAQKRLIRSFLELQTKLLDMQLDSMDTGSDYWSEVTHRQSGVYQTRLHHLLYGDSMQQISEDEREIEQREELKCRVKISSLKIRMSYVMEQVKQFFRHELRNNDVFLLLERAHYLELHMKMML